MIVTKEHMWTEFGQVGFWLLGRSSRTKVIHSNLSTVCFGREFLIVSIHMDASQLPVSFLY